MSIRSEVDSFCGQMMESDTAVVTSTRLVTEFMGAKRDEGWIAEPAECAEGLALGVAQMVREYLRGWQENEENPDPVQIALLENRPEEELIQKRYSVPTGEKVEGRPEYAYMRPDEMSEIQMRWRVASFRRLASHFIRHADALESWWYRNTSNAA